VQTYLRERIDEVLAGAAEPIVVRIFGADLKTLRSRADRVRHVLSNVDGSRICTAQEPDGRPRARR
jgi:Cu/Ag efflux pump CusA